MGVLIDNLLCTFIPRMIKTHASFSQPVTILRLTPVYYTDIISFMKNLQNNELIIRAERANEPPKGLDFFDQGAWLFNK